MGYGSQLVELPAEEWRTEGIVAPAAFCIRCTEYAHTGNIHVLLAVILRECDSVVSMLIAEERGVGVKLTPPAPRPSPNPSPHQPDPLPDPPTEHRWSMRHAIDLGPGLRRALSHLRSRDPMIGAKRQADDPRVSSKPPLSYLCDISLRYQPSTTPMLAPPPNGGQVCIWPRMDFVAARGVEIGRGRWSRFRCAPQIA